MPLRIPQTIALSLSLMLVFVTSGDLRAQSGCARCASPQRGPLLNRLHLVPTKSFTPSGSEEENVRFDKPRSPVKPLAGKPTIAEKIRQRYSDPRVVRMLQQLTPEGIESLYVEVSDLIDARHLAPATNSQRVDRALDHLIQALEIPTFVKAAQVQGTTAEISGFQDDLNRLRAKLRVRSTNDALSVLRNVQLMAAKSIDVDPSAIGLEFLYGATDSLDQFSMLLPPEKAGGPSVGLRDSMVGIGVEVEQHADGLKILKLLPGGPAAQADFRRGDVITHADGNDLAQLELNRAVDLIAGPVGTPVQIQATRSGRTGQVTLTRQKIAVHSIVDVRMEDVSQGVAYLKLEQFADSTTHELDAALMKLHQQGMQSLVMDLRGNPGGLLTTAIAVSDRFLPAGTIVSTRGRTQADNTLETAHYGRTWNVPLVVLIDHNSASASEIFAAAIQENHRGLIVGEKSYGKGTVQTLFPLQTFPAALRLTTAKFYSPQGREMAGAGVMPDVKVSNEPEQSRDEDAALMEALRQINDPKIKEMANTYRRTGETNDESHVAA